MGELYWKKFKKSPIRLQNWNYRSPGYYFITINLYGRWNWFGECNGKFVCLSDIGEIAWNKWKEIEFRYGHVQIHEFVVMPDHFHGIIEIQNTRSHMINHVATNGYVIKSGQVMKKNPMYSKGSISEVVRAYKCRVAIEARKIDSEFKWQSRFHDRIIRTEKELLNVRRYIRNNPYNWKN